jgi:hypothetical protein
MKPDKISFGLILFSILILGSCRFKQEQAARVKGESGELILKTEVVAGAKFSAKGEITVCPEGLEGQLITVASCDVVAMVTRKVPIPVGNSIEFIETTRQEVHTLEHKVRCVPPVKWELDCSDPLILQVPLDWKVAEATFSGDGMQGILIAEETIPAIDDAGAPYIAEPGYKLIVLGFPYGTPVDNYQIQLRFTYSNTGRSRVKAIFAAAMRITDLNGQVRMFYPPAVPAVHDFHLVQDPFFIADVTAARIFARQMDEREASAQSLPQTGTRTYFVLSTQGAAPATVDLKALSLKME